LQVVLASTKRRTVHYLHLR